MHNRLAFHHFVLVGFVFSASSVSAADPRAATSPELKPIWKTSGPIRMDGRLDEPAWKQAAAIDVPYIHGKTGVKTDEPRMTARFTWDGDYLYIGYETFDKNLVALGSGKLEGPQGNEREGAEIWHQTTAVDVVEFFISFGDRNFFWEIHHTAANQFNDIWITVVDDSWPLAQSSLAPFGILFGFGETIVDDKPAGIKLATAARTKPKADGSPSSVGDPSDVDTGYVGEIRLPWNGLGPPRDRMTWVPVEPQNPDDKPTRKHGPWKMAGQELQLRSVVQDGDLTERYHHSSPTFPGGWFHKGFEHWPRYVLKDAPEGR